MAYHRDQPKSVFKTGSDNPDMTVFCLHDSGGNGNTMYGMRRLLAKEFPTAQIISINGVRRAKSYKQPGLIERFKHGLSGIFYRAGLNKTKPVPFPDIYGFRWYKHKYVPLSLSPDMTQQIADALAPYNTTPPERNVVFGISQGGFAAAQLVHDHPELARHAVSFASGLVGRFNRAANGKPCTFDSVISVHDQYLAPFFLAAPVHLFNMIRLRMNGHAANVKVSYGFGHNLTSDKPRRLCVDVIRKRFGTPAGALPQKSSAP